MFTCYIQSEWRRFWNLSPFMPAMPPFCAHHEDTNTRKHTQLHVYTTTCLQLQTHRSVTQPLWKFLRDMEEGIHSMTESKRFSQTAFEISPKSYFLWQRPKAPAPCQGLTALDLQLYSVSCSSHQRQRHWSVQPQNSSPQSMVSCVYVCGYKSVAWLKIVVL